MENSALFKGPLGALASWVQRIFHQLALLFVPAAGDISMSVSLILSCLHQSLLRRLRMFLQSGHHPHLQNADPETLNLGTCRSSSQAPGDALYARSWAPGTSARAAVSEARPS